MTLSPKKAQAQSTPPAPEGFGFQKLKKYFIKSKKHCLTAVLFLGFVKD
jgi:hypothetical protein